MIQTEDQTKESCSGASTSTEASASTELIADYSGEEYFYREAQAIGIPEYKTAIERRSASFAQLAGSIFFSRETFTKRLDQREICAGYIRPLTEAFEAAHGPITRSFYCQNVMAAAVLTAHQELWWVIPPPLDPHIVPIAEIINECQRLDTEVDRVLSGPERFRDLRTTKTLIYDVIASLLSCLDGNGNQSSPDGMLDLQWCAVARAKNYYKRAATLYAQFDYLIGMSLGAAISLGLVLIALTMMLFRPVFLEEGRTFIGCLIAGEMGAVLSVMSRMTFGGLSLDYEAGRRILTMLGAFRPVIGMVLGAAMWVLTGSGVLVVVPSDSSKISFFRLLIAFLAGFSERWAQDMLGRTTEYIQGRGSTTIGSERDIEYSPPKRGPNSKGRR